MSTHTHIISFLKIEWSLFVNLESPSPKDALCLNWLKLAQWSWRRKFKNFANVFSLFPKYLPLKKGMALPLNKFETQLFKDASCVTSLVEISAVVLKKIFKCGQCIFAIWKLSPFEKGCGPSFEQTLIPFTQESFELCQIWLKLAQWFWRRYLNFINVFSLFHKYLPLEKGVTLHLNKLESKLPKNALF